MATWRAWTKMLAAAAAVVLVVVAIERREAEPSTVERQGAGGVATTTTVPNTTRPATAEVAGSPDAEVFTVRSVTDGDTLTISDGRTIRLAQVDAPETGECFGSESTAALRAMVADQEVTLRRPDTAPATDRYGRTLAEVYVGTRSIDEALIRDGAAEWYDEFAHEDADLAGRLADAEQEAKAAGRGLWAACKAATSAGPPTTPPSTPPTTAVAAPVSDACHAGYPDECIPPAPPDLDCRHIGHTVRVDRRYGDPHGLDADGDGWGCESYG